jgi:hypothetical protein
MAVFSSSWARVEIKPGSLTAFGMTAATNVGANIETLLLERRTAVQETSSVREVLDEQLWYPHDQWLVVCMTGLQEKRAQNVGCKYRESGQFE